MNEPQTYRDVSFVSIAIPISKRHLVSYSCVFDLTTENYSNIRAHFVFKGRFNTKRMTISAFFLSSYDIQWTSDAGNDNGVMNEA